MSITKEQVEHVARLARLELEAEEVEALCGDLSRILDYVETLNELDTDNVAPLTHPAMERLVLRDDQVKPTLSREIALKEAPRAINGTFAVPQFVEEG